MVERGFEVVEGGWRWFEVVGGGLRWLEVVEKRLEVVERERRKLETEGSGSWKRRRWWFEEEFEN